MYLFIYDYVINILLYYTAQHYTIQQYSIPCVYMCVYTYISPYLHIGHSMCYTIRACVPAQIFRVIYSHGCVYTPIYVYIIKILTIIVYNILGA